MFRAVIFDFDGVIADSEPLHFEAFRLVLADRGVEIPKARYYADYLGYSDVDCIKEMNRDFDLSLDRSGCDELLRQKGVVFDKLAAKSNIIIDGAAEFIDMLGANGIVIAVCSGSLYDEIMLALKSSGFADAFETIIAADDVSAGKPDPEGYLLALKRLNGSGEQNIAADDCVVIEDSHWGLESARGAGMHTIAITNTYSESELADYAEITVAKLCDISIDNLKKLCD
ncbi:MAG: HAD family phosphatase [Planctomycetes bacterium]|nr:HAD family phosphatase [Planctomycetota bacterium]